MGGAGTVSKSCFEGFSYTALGHLHCPQSTGDDKIQYSGSLMKYSFAESDHDKSVSLVEIDKTGFCSVERVHLSPRRDVRRVKGCIEDMLKCPGSDDYVEVTLLDRAPILDAIGKLRSVYPNTLTLADNPDSTKSKSKELQRQLKITASELENKNIAAASAETFNAQLKEANLQAQLS